MTPETLFQDLVPTYLKDLKPYCRVFLRATNISPLETCLVSFDELLSRFQKTNVKKERIDLIDRFIHKKEALSQVHHVNYEFLDQKNWSRWRCKTFESNSSSNFL